VSASRRHSLRPAAPKSSLVDRASRYNLTACASDRRRHTAPNATAQEINEQIPATGYFDPWIEDSV